MYGHTGSMRAFFTGLIVKNSFFTSTSPSARTAHRQVKKRQVSGWQQLVLNGQRSGPEGAPVQIVEFFDYECPFCKASEPALKAVRQKYPKKVAIIHENFPLTSIHPYAFKASIAAECARRQNPGKFMSYHNALFARQDQLGQFSYVQLAAQIGIADTASFHQCLEAKKRLESSKPVKLWEIHWVFKALPHSSSIARWW